MNTSGFELEGLRLEKNSDGTYYGWKEQDIYCETTNQTYKATLEYPRIQIKWMNNIEFGIPEEFCVLPDYNNKNYWELTTPE